MDGCAGPRGGLYSGRPGVETQIRGGRGGAARGADSPCVAAARVRRRRAGGLILWNRAYTTQAAPSPSSRGLGLHSFKVATRVRIPLGTPHLFNGLTCARRRATAVVRKIYGKGASDSGWRCQGREGPHRTRFEALIGQNQWTADCFWMRCRRSDRQCRLYPARQTILRAGAKVR